MKERPILFSAPMVRALLDDSKTKTRRVVKQQPDSDEATGACWVDIYGRHQWAWHSGEDEDILPNEPQFFCPYGQPGDRLYVKETFFAWGRWETRFSAKKGRDEWHFVDMTLESGRAYAYSIPHEFQKNNQRNSVTPSWWKRHSIFMPRAASRITLEITSVRVERLQDISESDARAEGVTDGGCTNCGNSESSCGCLSPSPDARDAYCNLWGQINGKQSWHENPWVWVVEFKRIQGDKP